eukprot:7659984-Pyramimonas_sp.AAC.1
MERATLIPALSDWGCDALSGRHQPLRGSLGGSRGRLGSLGGVPGSLFKAFRGLLEASWGPPGGLVRPPGSLFGRGARNVGPCLLSRDPLGAILAPSEAVLEAAGAAPWASRIAWAPPSWVVLE